MVLNTPVNSKDDNRRVDVSTFAKYYVNDDLTTTLKLYESYYKNSPCTYKPKVRVIFDNDNQGRTSYKKVKPNSYNNIIVKCELLKNYCEKSPQPQP